MAEDLRKLYDGVSSQLDFGKNWMDFESDNSNLLIGLYKDYKYAIPDLDHLDGIISNLEKTNEEKLAIYEKFEGLVIVDFVPTSENLCKWWHEVANKMLIGFCVGCILSSSATKPVSICIAT